MNKRKKVYRIIAILYLALFTIFSLMSFYYQINKDMFNMIAYGFSAVASMITFSLAIILYVIEVKTEKIIDRIENGNQYERQVLKRLHDELIKADVWKNGFTI